MCLYLYNLYLYNSYSHLYNLYLNLILYEGSDCLIIMPQK